MTTLILGIVAVALVAARFYLGYKHAQWFLSHPEFERRAVANAMARFY